jgi:hypothetical protein
MWNLSWWADPIVFGKYPADGLKAHAANLPEIRTGDMKLISQPIDYLATNTYNGYAVRAAKGGKPERVPGGWGTGNPRGTLPWLEISDAALYWTARYQAERYQLPFVFTENGFCNTDFVHRDGVVHDPQRIDYLGRYLGGLQRAVRDGVPVEGYFYWSRQPGVVRGLQGPFRPRACRLPDAEAHAEEFLSLVPRPHCHEQVTRRPGAKSGAAETLNEPRHCRDRASSAPTGRADQAFARATLTACTAAAAALVISAQSFFAMTSGLAIHEPPTAATSGDFR